MALAVAAILLGANVTTELLKHVLAEPSAARCSAASCRCRRSWPSGHSTAAMSLALASVLAAPARAAARSSAALGASFAIAVGYSVLATGMHYPSDVLGGFLVAATWTLAGGRGVAGRRAPAAASSARRSTGSSMRAALGRSRRRCCWRALVLAAIVVLMPAARCRFLRRRHEAFVVGAAAIAALGLALSTGVC